MRGDVPEVGVGVAEVGVGVAEVGVGVAEVGVGVAEVVRADVAGAGGVHCGGDDIFRSADVAGAFRVHGRAAR